jgi:hypothetical protein
VFRSSSGAGSAVDPGIAACTQFNALACAAFYVSAAAGSRKIEITLMAEEFKVGDHVTWNSEAGYVSGMIVKVHTRDVDYKGYMHHANKNDPQYEIKSSRTDHIAMHKGGALKKVSD